MRVSERRHARRSAFGQCRVCLRGHRFRGGDQEEAWELNTPDDLMRQVRANAFEELPVTFEHGLAAGQLPLHHKDLFARLLIADRMVRLYDVRTMAAS